MIERIEKATMRKAAMRIVQCSINENLMAHAGF
jgi:hypothetical protein